MSNTTFKIDNREHKLIKLFENSKQSISYEVETLVHGDIQLIHEQNPLFIIERKSRY
jgi:ERCC4-type nuclease